MHRTTRTNASPWPGSTRDLDHRWALDACTSLPAVVEVVRRLGDELARAHASGWWLTAPVRGGRLHLARASRRQRGRADAPPTRPPAGGGGPRPPWRLRVVEAGPRDRTDAPRLDLATATATPVVRWDGSTLRGVGGPPLPDGLLDDVTLRLGPAGVRPGDWAVARARVGPNVDLVADGAPLRGHAVASGVLVRTVEATDLARAAEGATTLAPVVLGYQRLADTTAEMVAAGGRLLGVDDGLVEVGYAASYGPGA